MREMNAEVFLNRSPSLSLDVGDIFDDFESDWFSVAHAIASSPGDGQEHHPGSHQGFLDQTSAFEHAIGAQDQGAPAHSPLSEMSSPLDFASAALSALSPLGHHHAHMAPAPAEHLLTPQLIPMSPAAPLRGAMQAPGPKQEPVEGRDLHRRLSTSGSALAEPEEEDDDEGALDLSACMLVPEGSKVGGGGNGANSSISSIFSSPPRNGRRFKGVRHRKWGRYTAEIRDAIGKRIWLGSYDSEEEAARVYDMAARILQGDGAWLNFPDEVPEAVTLPRSTVRALIKHRGNIVHRQSQQQPQQPQKQQTNHAASPRTAVRKASKATRRGGGGVGASASAPTSPAPASRVLSKLAPASSAPPPSQAYLAPSGSVNSSDFGADSSSFFSCLPDILPLERSSSLASALSPRDGQLYSAYSALGLQQQMLQMEVDKAADVCWEFFLDGLDSLGKPCEGASAATLKLDEIESLLQA